MTVSDGPIIMNTTPSIKPLVVLLNRGALSTLKDKPGSTYDGITAQQIAAMVATPQSVSKSEALFIIPSEYREHDGRSHEAQRTMGQYRYLAFDIDSGNHTLAKIKDSFEAIFPDAGMMIYSSASASEENKKWRVLVPLRTAIAGANYPEATMEAADMLRHRGITCDPSLTRCGQPVYLPNVPPERRDEAGEPLFYQSEIVRKRGYEYHGGDIEQAVRQAEIRRQALQEQAAADRERRAAERAAQRASRGDEISAVEEFNARHSVADILAKYGYAKQGRSDQYRSPNQSSGSYAVKDFGTHWVSLSGSDVSLGIGQVKDGWCWGDAFDLFCFYVHGGDMKAAVRSYGAEIRGPQLTTPDDPLADFEFVSEISSAPEANETTPEQQSNEISSDDDWQLPDAGDEPPEPQHWPTPATNFDSSVLPRREWIYGHDYIRKYVSVLASAGGIGKTSLTVVEALAIVTGRNLLDTHVKQQCNVWIVNLEDPRLEIEMRMLAAMQHYKIEPSEVRGKLFYDGEDTFAMTLAAEGRDGLKTNDALLEMMTRKVREHNIGVVIIDPFVSTHLVNENSNSGIQAVVAMIRKLARDTNSSVSLVHHVRKGNGDDATVDSVRGAGALIGAARAARVINRITEDDALRMGVDQKIAKGIFRVDDGKANLAPPADKAVYRRMIGVQIDNEEWVGVCVPFEMPDPFDDVGPKELRKVQDMVAGAEANEDPYRANVQAKHWVGNAVATVLGLDGSDKAHRARIGMIMKTWIANDALRVETTESKRDGREVPCVFVGNWVKPEEME